MNKPTAHEIRITDHGPPSRPFGWEIYRQDSVNLASSTKTFRTRGEALADSARVAAGLVLAPSKVKSPE